MVECLPGERGESMKVSLGALNCLYPMPTVLVGANVDGKPNYIAIAHVGIMNFVTISLSMSKIRYTIAGIEQNKTFSVNLPTAKMAREVDYCGMVSGKDADKGKLFENFYGKLQTAPMIKGCPVNMECRLIQTIDFQKQWVFIGEIIETYCDDEYLTDGIVDFSKIQPILYVMNNRSYWNLGAQFAKRGEIALKHK